MLTGGGVTGGEVDTVVGSGALGRDMALVGVGLGEAGEEDGDDHRHAKSGERGVGPVENVPAGALLVEALSEEGAIKIVSAVLYVDVEITEIESGGGHRGAADLRPENRGLSLFRF